MTIKKCCCEGPPGCKCFFSLSPSKCTLYWQCDLSVTTPYAVRVVTVDASENILTVVSTASSGFVNPPINTTTRYRLLVCCDAPGETVTDCVWQFNGTSWILVASPEGCTCTSIPAPVDPPSIGTQMHLACESGPPE